MSCNNCYIYSMSFCCCNVTPEMVAIIGKDCYMDGLDSSKLVFSSEYFTYIENSCADEDWIEMTSLTYEHIISALLRDD